MTNIAKNALAFIVVACVSVSGTVSAEKIIGKAVAEKVAECRVAKNQPIARLENNGKILSAKGMDSLRQDEIVSISVNNDTICIMVKKDALTRLDNDKTNYADQKVAGKNTEEGKRK